MSDPTQSPQPGEEPDAAAAAAAGPDAPTLAHPAAPSDLSTAAGFPSAEPAIASAEPAIASAEPATPLGEPAIPVPPADPDAPTRAVPPVSPPGSDDGGAGSGPAADIMAAAQERPELAVGAAFAGGLVLAMILKRFAR